ncbi:HCP-like protein [Polychaeton citri CBS 116435]|uniref:HCP-like protein n=1 Tax=Polychaeton citri CBS 116435 TaxID=1314669 RepID=A0A9P4Q6R2_9PEZI|nr:HCP-like protein [Polychaeton citri CBS 116435]
MHRPDIDRNYSGQTIWSEPGGEARGRNLPASVAVPPKAPIEAQSLLQPAPETQYGAPLTQQRSAPEPSSNPDTLPHHPVPVRPGLLEQHVPQPAKPVPVRQHDNVSPSAREQRMSATASLPDTPVTHAELDQLRRYVTSNPQNPKQALVLVKKLVEASNVLSSDNGRLDPKSTAKNREKYIVEAHKRLKKLASAGFPDAMFYMAECHGQGSLGLEADTKEAFNFYLAAAKQGHAQAAYRTAVCCEIGPEEGGGTRKDPQKALQWYKRAAVLGDPAGMFKVGIICLKGLMGQPRNVGEGVTWLKRAVDHADNDNPHALHELANLHDPASQTDPEIRSKVVPDENYARELFARAAKLGYKQSQFRLGQANEYGSLGFAIDNRASISWYSKAAAQGEHQAELALSGWYLTGAEGILKNSDTEAYLWARKAACSEPPLAKAMFAMGYFSEMGIGCPKSIEEARRWYGRAAAHKFPKAIERIEELKKAGSRSGSRPQPTNGKLTRKDQKKDEAECVVM